MKNITVSLDDETYRWFLVDLASGDSEAERLKQEERELRQRITAFRASDRLSRDAVHDRGS
jgi:hypothetical protein